MLSLGRLFQQLPSFAWSFHSRDQVLRSLTWLMSALCHGRGRAARRPSQLVSLLALANKPVA
eukprot:11659633-Alexandrium_andersonii.AAC.1